MLLRALSPDTALSASFIFGDETPSYQNSSSRFQKLFAALEDQTMTGLILDFSNSSIAKLVEVETSLLELFGRTSKFAGKAPMPALANEGDKISFAESASFSGAAPPHYIRLLKIVGVWDTEKEYGLVYKFIRSQSLLIQQSVANTPG